MMLLISFWYKIGPKTPFPMFTARSPGFGRFPKHHHSWLIGTLSLCTAGSCAIPGRQWKQGLCGLSRHSQGLLHCLV